MAIRSLIQIVKGLEDIASAHQQVNSFGFGDRWELNTSGVTEYPVVWAQLDDTVRSRTLTGYNFTIFCLDRVLRGEENETEVLSDMHRVAEDVIAEIRHDDWTWNVARDQQIAIENFTEHTPDILAGVSFKVQIRVVADDNTCQIPSGSITRF